MALRILGLVAALQDRILNGVEVPIHDYPYTAGLELSILDGQYFCTAVVIASRTLLTAGHCCEQ